MAFDLIAAYAQADTPFYLPGQAAQRLTEAPQQITLRFSPGVKIEAGSLTSTSIVVQRSGGAVDAFGLAGTQTDVTIAPGSITVNDLPNQNEVVIRFAETPLDDTYRITIKGGASGIKSMTGDTLAADRSFDFRLDLGAFVVSVVPQPVTRAGGTLAQSRNTVDVYFNRNDPLDPASAQQVTSYRLFEIDPATGDDLAPLAPVNPSAVSYNATTGKATLTFASDLDEDRLFRLQIGAAAALVPAAPLVAEGSDDNSSFATARNLGALTAAGASVDGAISRPRDADPTPANQGTLGSPAGNLQFPSQIGTIDEPGHRQETFIPVDSHAHGNAAWTTSPDAGVTVQFYNFKAIYGVDGQGNSLTNAITENQKQRAREVFELFSRYTGIRFVESAADGLTVATGDPRALDPLVPPTSVDGIASELPQVAIMNSLVDWGQSEYGGRYFLVCMHEIGHALRLAHSYDVSSIMGAGLTGEPVFPGDYDTIHLAQLYPAINSDVDTYRFTVSEPGTLSAQTVIARPGQVAISELDSLLTLYREDTISGKVVRTLVARNDDSFGRDSFIGLNLQPGTYFITVTSTGNDAFNPEVSDSGYGGRSAGDYRLELGFQPRSTAATTIVDTSGSLFDGDRDGTAGGAFNFWFKTATSTGDAATNRTLFVDKAAYPDLAAAIAAGADGTIAKPFYRIQDAIAAALVSNAEDAGNGVDLRTIIRIVGNDQNTPYLVGSTLAGGSLDDGDTFNVPEGVTVMIDAGAVVKLRAAVVDVGSSSPLVGRAGAAFQVLGTPDRNVIFTSYHDDTVGGDSDDVGPAATGGQWGGIVLRQDSDSATKRAFVNSIANASIRYGGGQVLVDSVLASFAPIQLETTRPTIAFNTITDSAGAAIAADPNSFEESNGRVGPEIRGNRMIEVRLDGLNNAPLVHQNSINGLFIKIRTEFGQPLDRLDVPARLKSTDIVYVLQENLLINGGAGGYVGDVGGPISARQSGRLAIDPGVVVKLQASRIELERGISQLVAEGTATNRVIFTSLGDNRFGAGGTFDTNGNLPDVRAAGDWGGIVLNAGAKASIDYAYMAFGGGQTPIEGAFDYFNVIETHQGDLRVAHSRLENNAAGIDPAGTPVTNRAGRGGNAAATIFVRGAQPVILDNDFRGNLGAAVSVNANALNDIERPDPGRSTGPVDRDRRYDDNRGPLVRGNRLPFDPVAGSISGLQVRGEEITVESVWDDTDIVHVLQSEIVVQNFHTATGLRLVSRPDASLVVKQFDPDGTGPLVAGITASGYQLDIDDRIGGTVQIIGQPGYPVVLTSLKDDTVGASVDPLGRVVKDTGNDGNAAPAAGDWRGLKFTQYSNDRNVAIVREVEKSLTGSIDANGLPSVAQQLGTLAPNFATGGNTPESAQEKSGDENRRLGFEVHGRIAADDVTDVDVYSFFGYSGSEVWIDVDKSSDGLDSMLELLDASGVVLARSADAQTDASLLPVTRGLTVPLSKNPAFGGDFYTTNPRDAGMRVTLPSRPGQPTGSLTQYYVRVRSQPRYEPATTGADNGGVTATDKAAYEADLRDAGKVKAGATNGAYELRVRLRQQDEKPGSTVRYADIRYPTIGIDVQGLPRSSPLVGESGESAAVNDLFASAQYVGNLLQSDRGTISIGGIMQSATDVDWYTFALNLEQIQSIGGFSDALKSWATVFDIDYGDGLRGDLVISVFNADGQLLYVGRDSNVASDQPGVGQGNDFDDLSRGSLGKLDPFIGSVQLPAGNPTGGGGIESGLPVTASDPARQLRYYVAVSSNQKLPTVLDAYFNASATNSLVRLEPINSVSRIAEDHIGFDGYLSGPSLASTQVTPQTKLFDTTDETTLSLHVTPFTLSDVTLFVYTGTTIETVDAMRGGNETILSQVLIPPANAAGDIAMRSDGKLFQYRPGSNAGILYSVNTVTGATTVVGDDNIPTPPEPTPAPPAPPAEAQQTLSPQELGGQTSTFAFANAGLLQATVNGTLRYTDTTGGVNGTAVTYSWSFTSNGTGTLSFTNIPTPAPPAGFAAPTTGTVTVGAYVGNTLQNAVATINWSKAIDMTKLQMSVQYSYRTPPVPNPDSIDSSSVDALAFRRVPGLSTAHQLYYSVNAGGGQSALYSASATTGNAATSRIGTGTIASAVPGQIGVVTGLAFVADTMYGVDTNGNVFQFSVNVNNVPQLAVSVLHTEAGVRFAGLAAGPANLQNGAFATMVFAITDDGDLYAFDTVTGNPEPVFDSDGDGVADATSIPTGAIGAWSGVLGLAFSPLDVNLWHPTVRRGRDAGHGINESLDETRNELDNSNFAINYQSSAPNRKFLPGEGGASMYFGLETYVRPTAGNATPYLNYESQEGQLGVLDSKWQQDLTSAADTMIGNNYNLPGGAYGSLITNTFSLANSTYNDKPTLYFNYWLETENVSGAFNQNNMRDSARVFVSDNGGQWQVVASNNSDRSAAYTSKGELPNFVSASSALTTADNQHVQELYDTGTWRQARIDLGKWAGSTNLRLRFDFSTAGEFDSTQLDASGNPLNDIAGYAGTTGDFSGSTRSRERGQNNAFEGFYVDDVIIGYAERGEMVTGITKTSANTSFFDIVTPPAAVVPGYTLAQQSLTGPYQLEIRRGTEYGEQKVRQLSDVTVRRTFGTNEDLVASKGYLGDGNQPREQGQFLIENNTVSDAALYGISIDSVAATTVARLQRPAVGYGRLVQTGFQLQAGQSYRFTARYAGNVRLDPTDHVPQLWPTAPTGTIVPLEPVSRTYVYRDGWTYCEAFFTPEDDNTYDLALSVITINSLDVTDVSLKSVADQSKELVRNGSFERQLTGWTTNGGTVVLASVVDENRVPVVRNLPTLNSGRLAPGVVVVNNVINEAGTAGILFNGDAVAGRGVVPFGRIVNNTIYGGATPKGTGIAVTENAGPTLLNNLFANLAKGVDVDASSQPNTVIGGSAYHQVTTQVAGATQSQQITLTTNPFVNAAARNFYLAAKSAAIDSSVNSLVDRPAMVAVTSPLGIPQSPILAPERDRFGQLRSDDPSQASAPGLGSNVFKDRGAIDRVDFNQPSAQLALPLDNSPSDKNTSPNGVRLERADARNQTRFEIQLDDVGVGIDRSTVKADAFEFRRNGALLVVGTDYLFNYLESSNRVVFESSSVYAGGAYELTVKRTNGATGTSVLTDLAGNALLPNRTTGATSFTIELADVPTVPAALTATSGNAQVALGWTAATSDGTPLLRYEIEWATSDTFAGATTINVAAPAVTQTVTPLTNGTLYWFRIRAVNAVGPSDWSAGVGPVVPLRVPSMILRADTGASGDGITKDGRVTIGNLDPGTTWEWSRDGGTNWTTGAGTTFTLPAGSYAAAQVQARQRKASSIGSAATNPIAWAIDMTAPNTPTLALGTGVANGATLAEATQATGVVTVSGEAGATITVTFSRVGGGTVTKTLTGTGAAQPVQLTAANVTTLGNGAISVSATQVDAAGNAQTGPAATTSFTLDTVAPNAPTLVLGTGVANGATQAEATQATGVVRVTAETGAAVTVTFARVGGGTVTKTLTGTGAAQAVVLTATDVGTLGNGLITVTAGVADPAGNTSQASTTFTLDTVAPNSPTLALGTGVANGATAAEATQATGVVRVTAETGAAVTVTFSRVGGGTVTKTLTGSGITQAVVLTAANVTTLGNGLINVSATQVDAAGNAQTDAAATTSFSLDTVAPNAPTLALGTGVALGATAPEATHATGVVRVTADAGAVVTVTFSRVGGGTVTKTLTGTGAAQAVVLTAANLTTLGNGVINVAATQVDAAGNAQTGAAATTSFTLDTVTPTVTGVTSAVANGTYGTGQIIPVQVRFSEAVVVTGTPTLALNTTPARTATYASGGGTNTLVFNYVIQLGDTAARLDQRSTTALALNGGTILDAAGNDAVRTLAAPGTAGSLGASKVITVAGVLKATVAGFGTTSPGPAFTTAVTRIPITFNAPVTGFTLASLKLFYQDRPVSLAGATLTGSGANYVLTLPRTTASLRGRYRLDIGGPGTGIVSGGVPMSTKTSIYWQRI